MLVQNQGDFADEGSPDAGAPLAGDHGGICGDHEPGCAGLVYTCRLSRSIQLKSAVRNRQKATRAGKPTPQAPPPPGDTCPGKPDLGQGCPAQSCSPRWGEGGDDV